MALGIYAALPPEVNVGRLLAGMGAGPWFGAAAGFTAMAEAATTLAAASDAQVQSLMTTWWGVAADRAIPAFLNHSTWLREFAAVAQTAAVQATAVGSGYLTAVATSPTIPELAVNRTTLFTLIATNFLGINTPAIAVNEADYMRMWFQAAGAMSTYDAEATANSIMPAIQQAPAITSQLMGPLSSLTGPLSSLVGQLGSAAQANESELDKQTAAAGDGDLRASAQAGFLGITPGSRVLDELRGQGATAAPVLTSGGLDEMSGTNTGFYFPGAWSLAASGAASGDPAGTRPGAPASTSPGAAPMGAAPMAAAARPGSDAVAVADRHREVPTPVAVIDFGGDEDEEVQGPVST